MDETHEVQNENVNPLEYPDEVYSSLADWRSRMTETHAQVTTQLTQARELVDAFIAETGPLGRGVQAFTRLYEVINAKNEELKHLHRRIAELTSVQESTTASIEEHISSLDDYAHKVQEMQQIIMRQNEAILKLQADADQERKQAEIEMAQLKQENEILRAANTAIQRPSKQEEFMPECIVSTVDESGHRRRLGEILVDAGFISPDELEAAVTEQSSDPRRRLGAILVHKGAVSEQVLAHILAAQLELPYLVFSEDTVMPDAPPLIPLKLAKRHVCIPVRVTPAVLVVAMANPLDLVAIEDLERASGRLVKPIVATESDILRAIERYYTA